MLNLISDASQALLSHNPPILVACLKLLGLLSVQINKSLISWWAWISGTSIHLCQLNRQTLPTLLILLCWPCFLLIKYSHTSAGFKGRIEKEQVIEIDDIQDNTQIISVNRGNPHISPMYTSTPCIIYIFKYLDYRLLWRVVLSIICQWLHRYQSIKTSRFS